MAWNCGSDEIVYLNLLAISMLMDAQKNLLMDLMKDTEMNEPENNFLDEKYAIEI